MTEKKHFKDRNSFSLWIWERKFRVLLFMLVGMLIGYPYLQAEGRAGQTAFEVMFTALLFVSTYVLCDTRRNTQIALMVGLPAVGAQLLYVFFPESVSYGLPMGIFCIFYAYMIFSALRHVAAPGDVTTDIISGAVCVYILLGMTWAMAFAFLEHQVPGSFISFHAESPFQEESVANLSRTHFTTFLYFSYTTMTTLGYGDIVPVTPGAQSLTSLEAITGVLYIGAFVARLISTYQPKGRRTDYLDQ